MLGHMRTRRRSDAPRQRQQSTEPADSAESVILAAARLLGKPAPSPLLLDKHDIFWDWQLRSLSEHQFEALGCSPGLQAAIFRILDTGPRARSVCELPRTLQRFLLLREADGSEPPRLRAVGCLLLGILLQPQQGSASPYLDDEHIANVLFSTGELLAILAGLSIAVPISLRTAVGDEVVDWEEAPRSALALDIAALVVMCTLFSSIVAACAGSLMVRIAGTMDSFIHALTVLGQSLMWWVISINLIGPLVGLYTYHSTGHLAPTIATGVLVQGAQAAMVTVMIKRVMAESMPLELLHIPCWWRYLTALTNPPAAPYLLCDLEAEYGAAARARANMLIQRAGLELPPPAPRDATQRLGGKAVV